MHLVQLLGGLGSRKTIEVGAGDLSSLKDSVLYLFVFDKTAMDPEVGIMLVVLLSNQEFLSKFRHLCLIVG